MIQSCLIVIQQPFFCFYGLLTEFLLGSNTKKIHFFKSNHFLCKLKNGPPKDIHIKCLEPMNIPLFGRRNFVNVIKLSTLKWGANPGLSGWILNAIASVLMKERLKEIIHHHMQKGLYEDRGRLWNDAAISQRPHGMPAATRS